VISLPAANEGAPGLPVAFTADFAGIYALATPASTVPFLYLEDDTSTPVYLERGRVLYLTASQPVYYQAAHSFSLAAVRLGDELSEE
jgi:hypothetical protein